MQKDMLIIHTDGGSRGNPGPAACGYVVELNGEVLATGSKFLDSDTNNVAEYYGVIVALKWLLENIDKYSVTGVLFILDSELVVKQINGLYKIKKPQLQVLHSEILRDIEKIKIGVSFKHVPREQNKVADSLVNEELDRNL
jgi:ribonuclease HI